MSRPFRVIRAIGACLVIAALAAMGIEGCATKMVAPSPADVPPPATSPAGAVRRLEWAMSHHVPELVEGLLTDDFLLIGAGTDSAGNPSRDLVGDPLWFERALRAMLDPANDVTLMFDENLVAFPDTRPGRNPGWHRQIRTAVDLRVRDAAEGTTFHVTGNALFFLTRGDSASIPRGMPDPATWWVDLLEDETLAGAGPPAATNPSFDITFARLLDFYHSRLAR